MLNQEIICPVTGRYCEQYCGLYDPCTITVQGELHEDEKHKLEITPIDQGLEPIRPNPTLTQVLESLGAMPPEGLFMGMASDGLPILLNLHDSLPGPFLVLGDSGAGKTDLLQLTAAATITHNPHQLRFCVLTNHPDEWARFEHHPNAAFIHALHTDAAQEVLLTCASWARGSHSESQSTLLFIDNLESATDLDFEARQAMRWLFSRGPSRRVWPIVTLNADRSVYLQPWLESFRTRFFGKIINQELSDRLGATNANLQSLDTNYRFTIREDKRWLPFWLPRLD